MACSKSCLSDDTNDSELAMYKKQAVNAVSFKFVYDKDDLENTDHSFKPLMAHQIFGNSESIFGYQSLSINLYYLHNAIHCLTDIRYTKKYHEEEQCDDINGALDPWLPGDYTDDKDKFLELLSREKHDRMFGEVLDEFKTNTPVHMFPDKNVEATYKITLVDTTDQNFVHFHQNFETFIVWFIDGANFLDITDKKWMIFYVYEEFVHPENKKLYRTPIGFCSVYQFFAYPDKIRSRISQFFILPTHQKRGIGTKFYQAVLKKLQSIPDIIDVTVEEPTPTFQKIREISDCQLIYKELKENNREIDIHNVKRMNQMFTKYKMCKRQGQRIRDILGCYKAMKTDPFEYNNFLEQIKKRIALNSKKDTQIGKKFFAMPGFVPEAYDTKAAVEAEFKRYLSAITPSVKFLVAHM